MGKYAGLYKVLQCFQGGNGEASGSVLGKRVSKRSELVTAPTLLKRENNMLSVKFVRSLCDREQLIWIWDVSRGSAPVRRSMMKQKNWMMKQLQPNFRVSECNTVGPFRSIEARKMWVRIMKKFSVRIRLGESRRPGSFCRPRTGLRSR